MNSKQSNPEKADAAVFKEAQGDADVPADEKVTIEENFDLAYGFKANFPFIIILLLIFILNFFLVFPPFKSSATAIASFTAFEIVIVVAIGRVFGSKWERFFMISEIIKLFK